VYKTGGIVIFSSRILLHGVSELVELVGELFSEVVS